MTKPDCKEFIIFYIFGRNTFNEENVLNSLPEPIKTDVMILSKFIMKKELEGN